jgi:hypothetical protein
MDVDEKGVYRTYLVVLATRVYEQYMQRIRGQYNVPERKMGMRLSPKLAVKVVQELNRQCTREQLSQHLGKENLTEANVGALPDGLIRRAFEGMSKMRDASRFTEEVTLMVNHLSDKPIPGIQVGPCQSQAPDGTANRLTDVASNYEEWHLILYLMYEMMTKQTDARNMTPLLARGPQHQSSLQTQWMDYFGMKGCARRREAEAQVAAGLQEFEYRCQCEDRFATVYEYQDCIRSVVVGWLRDQAEAVERAERLLTEQQRAKSSQLSARASSLHSLPPSPPRNLLEQPRASRGTMPQSLNAALGAYDDEDTEEWRDARQCLAPMQQTHGRRGEWEQRGGRGFSSEPRRDHPSRGDRGYATQSGYSTSGRTSVTQNFEEGCYIQMRGAVSKGIEPTGPCRKPLCQFQHGEQTWAHRCSNDVIAILASRFCGFGQGSDDTKTRALGSIAGLVERADINLQRLKDNCSALITAVEEFQASRQSAAASAMTQVPQSHSGAAGADTRPVASSSRPTLRNRAQHANVAFSEGLTAYEQEEADIEAEIHYASGPAHNG